MRLHRVRPGEDLEVIAKKYYGDNARKADALFIWRHNREEMLSPYDLYPGQLLVIPHHNLFLCGELNVR